jgi:hypothetical protein
MIRRVARSLLRSPHTRLFAVMAVAALAGKAVRDARSMPDDLPGLAHALGDDLGGCVDPASVRWEPSRGAVGDAVLGRSVLFLATGASCDAGPQPRDLFRGRVRVTPEGQLLSIAGTYNLTSTPLGDDHALVVRGQRAAFATNAYGQEQSVTALDLSGEGAQATSTAWQDRAMGYVTNLQETGSGEGVARIDVALDEPARAIGLALPPSGTALSIQLDSGTKKTASLDLERAELTGDTGGLHAEAARHLPKRFVFWAVDTVRAVPWIGPAPIAWMEEKTFWLRDQAKQLAFRFHGDAAGNDSLVDGAGAAAGESGTTTTAAEIARLDAAHAGDGDTAWPPAPVTSMWKTPEAGEGVWVTPQLSWMRPAIPGAPPAFFRTFVRPDPDRPYTRVLLVAMDMRQLDLDMEAGVEDPKPLTGPHGSGRLPRDPAVYTRVVAAFNGAFKTEHGNYGMMVHKRVLLPPQPGAASVVTLGDGRVGLGTWGDTKDVGGLVGIPDDDIQSFRQNMDALVDHGVVNPTGRSLWGYTLPGSGMQTERSALCVTNSGNLMYAWGDDVSATALGKAMSSAGCNYAIHLDMNPHHTGFIFSTIHELKGHDYRSELLTSLMEVSPDRYIEYSPKDFFYMMARDPAPPPVGSTAWQVDEGTQPAPAWLPGVWKNEQPQGILLTQLEPTGARARSGRRALGAARGADGDDDRQGARRARGAGQARAAVLRRAEHGGAGDVGGRGSVDRHRRSRCGDGRRGCRRGAAALRRAAGSSGRGQRGRRAGGEAGARDHRRWPGHPRARDRHQLCAAHPRPARRWMRPRRRPRSRSACRRHHRPHGQRRAAARPLRRHGALRPGRDRSPARLPLRRRQGRRRHRPRKDRPLMRGRRPLGGSLQWARL